MSLEDDEFSPPEASEEFVPVVFARSVDQAEVYCELLNDHDIPAMVGDVEDEDDSAERTPSMARGVPVLVPEALLDEAGEVIAEREDAEGEFELGEEDVDDEEDDEFDELDEEFTPGPPVEAEDEYLGDLDDLDDEDGLDDEDDEEDEDDEDI